MLGIGNLLLGDEGVGVHSVRLLQAHDLPAGTKVFDVGTSILEVLSDLENAERVIILDAMNGEGEPGTVYRVPLDQCSSSMHFASMHGFDFFRVLRLTNRDIPPDVIVFGVEPAHIGWSMKLSKEVFNAMPFLIKAVLREINLRPNMKEE